MTRWGMAIELKRCVGCYACVLACKAEHFLPPDIYWNRVLIGEKGKYPAVTKLIYSVRCNHCAEPKCVNVCPTGATQQRDGLDFALLHDAPFDQQRPQKLEDHYASQHHGGELASKRALPRSFDKGGQPYHHCCLTEQGGSDSVS